MPKITFVCEGKEIECKQGVKIRDVALANGIHVYKPLHRFFLANCHGFGLCGTCKVIVDNQENISRFGFREKLKFCRDDMGERLSCQAKVLGDIKVTTLT